MPQIPDDDSSDDESSNLSKPFKPRQIKNLFTSFNMQRQFDLNNLDIKAKSGEINEEVETVMMFLEFIVMNE